MKKNRIRENILYLYQISIKVLQSNIGKHIAHFFAHGGLHIFLFAILGVVSFYLYQYSTYDSNPIYKPIQVTVISPPNVPISTFNMFASIDTKKNIAYTDESDILSVSVSYKKFELDSLSSNNKYVDNGIYFYPDFKEMTGHYWGDSTNTVSQITNASSTISFYTPNAKIKDAIGDPKSDITNARYDLIAGFSSFSIIDSISNDYISHHQYFDITHDNYLREAIKGEKIFSNEKDPIYYRFYINIEINNYDNTVQGEITIDLSGADSLGIYTNPKEIISIFPQPDIIRLNKICYNSPSKIKSVLDNHGLYIFMEDINKRKQIENRAFLCTVLFGAAIAFMLDIFVNLIIKWRNLVDRKKQ